MTCAGHYRSAFALIARRRQAFFRDAVVMREPAFEVGVPCAEPRDRGGADGGCRSSRFMGPMRWSSIDRFGSRISLKAGGMRW